MMGYKGNLGEDGQTSGIIGHASQFSYTLPESLNVSLPAKPTFKCSFLLTWTIIIAAATSWLASHPSTGQDHISCCCYCLVAGPLPIHWVRPNIMLLLLPHGCFPLPICWVRP